VADLINYSQNYIPFITNFQFESDERRNGSIHNNLIVQESCSQKRQANNKMAALQKVQSGLQGLEFLIGVTLW
jgi:hypothetical protein